MDYKKVLSNCVTRDSDSSKAVVALLAGLAVGAVLGVLFAPKSGEETRSLITDKATDLKDSLKDKYQNTKDQVLAKTDELVDQVKSKASDLKDGFNNYKEEAINAVKGASDDANDAVQNA
ncbi:YtxH domain-containing protein [Pedobacter sp. MC2016-14]|uniref:YtxH domain-containing protein n=1 Tax=Pedobacter sp. MC2016-14 TaxID=2897327 RepID=UPI001E34BF25|nr:YtxH domain-containing protein [Pedobacter sp. MC2016-14]MCD0490127.1 YtxH domain-containing protein [Pedobacter sp. MC2016-14]